MTTDDRRHLPAVDRAIADLTDVRDLVVALAVLRDPTVSRPWRETTLDAARRAQLDYEARLELEDRVEEAPGEHRDAARADILDALAAVLARAETLATYVSRAAWLPVLPAAAADADPRPYLTRAARYLPAAVTAWTNGADIAHWAAAEAAAMRHDLEHTLALRIDGHTIKAPCPWCRGGLTFGPTLRVRILPGGEPGIVCESGACEPPARDVGTWWEGCPVWPAAQWEWLAARIARRDEREQLLQPPAPRPPASRAEGATGRAGTPHGRAAARELLDGVADPKELDKLTDM